jgi:pimeloyl-ACP methyl ester carboxylesterase
MNIQSKFITVRGMKTHYFITGEIGPIVLLIHGGGTDSAELSWGDVIAPLADAGFRVIAPDLPGYGDSDRPDIAYTMDFFISFVLDFLQALNISKVTIGGLSMGGGISLGFTLKWPEKVDRLILVDSYGIQRKVAMHFISWLLVKIPGLMESSWVMFRWSKGMARWSLSSIFHDSKSISDSLLDITYAETKKPYAGRAFTFMQRNEISRTGLKTVYLDRLPEIHSPTLIVHGRQDIAVPLACAEKAHKLIAGSQLHPINLAGHWSHREKPVEFLQTVISFLKTV